jgi:hypothetical protein
MKNLIKRLQKIPNMSEFIRQSGLPRRTVDRLKAGGNPSRGTMALLKPALEKYECSR